MCFISVTFVPGIEILRLRGGGGGEEKTLQLPNTRQNLLDLFFPLVHSIKIISIAFQINNFNSYL